jgi:predicted Zn finger-like uncharacterized protein
MKIKCTNCQCEGNIPDDKLPEGAVTVTCPKCKTKFQVVKESAQEFTFEQTAPAPKMYCPKCGEGQPVTETCIKCGIVVSKFINAQIKVKSESVNATDIELQSKPVIKESQATSAQTQEAPEAVKIPPTEPQLKSTLKPPKKFDKKYFIIISGAVYVVAIILARSGWHGMNMLLRPVTFLLVIALSVYITKLGYNRSLRIKGRATGTAGDIIGSIIFFIPIFVILTFVIIGGVMDKLLPTVSPAQIADSPKGSDKDSSGVSRKEFYAPNEKNCSDGCSLQFAPGTKEFDACVQACTH